jgi:hypothetical protein
MKTSHTGLVLLLSVPKVLGKRKSLDVPSHVINHVASWIQSAGMVQNSLLSTQFHCNTSQITRLKSVTI